MLIIIIIYIFIFYKADKVEKMADTTTTDQIKDSVRQIYQADVEAIRNLSNVATQLQAGGLTVPGKLASSNLNVTGGSVGDYQTPNGQMKITQQGIMFGGPNNGRQVDSAQISAGTHIPNSLNIVGMSADAGWQSRRVDMWTKGGLNVYGPIYTNNNLKIQGGSVGDYQTPNGQMKITQQGIMFGGPNNGRETNSAQISAGTHVADSLNIVGMSAPDKSNRRVDMWAEGGFNVNGPTNLNGNLKVNNKICIDGTCIDE